MTGRKKPKAASRSKRGKPANEATQALTAMEERFVHEYLSVTPYNASAAYKRAGYQADGQAGRTAAARLLKKPKIQAAIAAVREADARKFEVTRERVLAEYAKLAFFDSRKFYNADGTLKLPTELDDAEAAALIGYDVEEEFIGDEPDVEMEEQAHGGKLKRQHGRTLAVGRTVKIKYQRKKDALDSIVKMMGYAKDENVDFH